MSSSDKGSRLREVPLARCTADEVLETVRVFEKIITLGRDSENGHWDELFSEELKKPSIQLQKAIPRPAALDVKIPISKKEVSFT